MPAAEGVPPPITGLRVRRQPVNHRGDWLLLTLTDEEGREGLGEASHSGRDDEVIVLLRREVGARVVGVAWPEPAAAWAALRSGLAAETAPRVASTAASAVEQALWDLEAQRAGQPLSVHLGADPGARLVPLYANINRATVDRTPEGFARSARAAVRDGFRAIKLAPFDEVVRGAVAGDHERLARAGIERVAAVREAIGPAIGLQVDCHWRFTVESALGVAAALEPLALGWLEDPVPYEHGPGETAAVRRGAPMPIATGERLIGAGAFTPFIEAGAADFYLPDIKHIGGVGQLLALAHASRASGARITPHNPSGPVSTLVSAQVLAAIRHAGPLEFAWGEVAWRPEVLSPPEQIAGGALVLPGRRSGLGARLATVSGGADS